MRANPEKAKRGVKKEVGYLKKKKKDGRKPGKGAKRGGSKKTENGHT